MGRVYLRKLVLHNFRSFLGRHELAFPQTGVFVLHGHNRVTGGSSNSGKSNVLLALAYVFGHCPHPLRALQCWYTDDPMKVEAHLDTDDGPAVLERGDKLLRLTVKGRVYKGGAKAVEAELDRLCGAGADLREVLTYREQVKPRKFLDVRQRPGERDAAMKDFLVKVLRLEVLDKEVDRASKTLGPLEEARRQRAAALQGSQDALGRVKTDPALSWEPEPEEALAGAWASAEALVEERVSALRLATERKVAAERGVAAARAAADATGPDGQDLTRLRGLLDKCREHARTLAEIDRANQAAYDQETQRLDQEAAILRVVASRIDLKERELDDLRQRAQLLKDDKCPTCDRQWASAQVEAAHAVQRAERLAQEVRVDQLRLERLPMLEHALKGRAFAADPRLEKLRAAEVSLREQIASATAKIDAEQRRRAGEVDQSKLVEALAAVQEATRLYSAAQLACHERESALALARQRNVSGRETREAAERRVADWEKQVGVDQTQLHDAQKTWKQEADYVDLLKGFRNKVFDEVLASIGQRATEVVGLLPNAAHVSIEFRSEHVAGNGAVQDRITPVVYLHGVERRLEESVNGGTLTSIELAVDLAVAQAVSERLGCNLNWIVLDEAFDGHDPVTKNACLEMLRLYASDKLVVIVDHNAEFRDAAGQMATVEYDGRLSSFKKG